MKPILIFVFACLAELALAISPVFAELIPVPFAGFGSDTLYERFNEPIDIANAAMHPDSDNLWSMAIIGTNSPYVFTNTGVTFVSPVPNVHGNWLPIVSVLKGNQNFGFGEYGELLNGSGLIPGGIGAKALVQTGSSSVHFDPFYLTFPDLGAGQVGLYPIMAGGGILELRNPSLDRVVITAYGADNEYLGRMDCIPQHVSQWASNFWGFASSDGTPIVKIGVDYSDNYGALMPGIASLMFVPVVPEPGTLAMLASLVAMLLAWQILRKR